MPFDDLFSRLFRDQRRAGPSAAGGATNNVPPPSPEAREALLRALRESTSPRHAEEHIFSIRTIDENGDVLQRSEQWLRDGAAMKVINREVLVKTSTGDLVPAKNILVQCGFCGGYDSVKNHCLCGLALCRLHVLRDPADGSVVLCPECYRIAVENFDTWAAHDRQQNNRRNSHE